MTLVRPLVALVALGFAAPRAWADPFIYNDFSSTAGLHLNGVAASVNNALRLSTANPFNGGSAFTTSATALGPQNSFSTHFEFRITNSGGISDGDGVGADGLAFVIQTVSNNVGGLGGGIGYLGISPSVGIEFDTYDNGLGFGDPNGNHVNIDRNGTFASAATAVIEPTRFNNGRVWDAWVDYNGATQLLEVRWSQTPTRPAAAQLAQTLDLVSLLGQNSAFIGFTSATGSAWGNHEILNWQFVDRFAPIDSPVPEPATAAVFAAGLGLIGLVRRRRADR
jgi:hypothetical protein